MKSVEPFFHAIHHYSVEPGTACADCVKSMNWSHSVSLTLLSIQKSRQTAESHTKSKDSNLTQIHWKLTASLPQHHLPVGGLVSVVKVHFSQQSPQSRASQADSQLVH